MGIEDVNKIIYDDNEKQYEIFSLIYLSVRNIWWSLC